MPRGGRRQGAPGVKYANRTDLAQGPRALPVTTAPNQTYGEAGAQQAAQAAVPMGSGPLPTSPATSPQPQMTHADVMQAAQGYQPTPVVPLNMPTLRPDEHVMTGVGAPPPASIAPSPAVKAAAALASLGENAPIQARLMQQALNTAAMNGSGA